MDMPAEEIRKGIKEFVEVNDLNLENRLPPKTIQKLMIKLGVPRSSIIYNINKIRTGIMAEKAIELMKAEPSTTLTDKRADMIDKYISTSGDDITKMLPYGKGIEIAIELGISTNDFRNGLARLKKNKGIVTDRSIKRYPYYDEVCGIIQANMGKQIPRNTVPEFAEKHKLDIGVVRRIFKQTRKKLGSHVKYTETLKREKGNPLVAMVRSLNVIRKLPNQNRCASTTIIRGLQDVHPGGAALFIGTPTPFAVSDNPTNNCLLTDELEVAIALNMTTDPNIKPTIVIGDLITPERACVKGQMWLNNNSTNNWPIIVGPVDRNSYTRHVVKMAEQHSLTKVVLMTSGVWSCNKDTERKYGQDFNFKSPSEYLCSVYPNLHIFAMVMVNGNQFNILHLHDGKVETL